VTRTETPPVGTIALLFTDVEGSTELARCVGAEWPEVLAEHHRLVGQAIHDEGGWVDGTEGDAFFATFSDPAAAARAAVSALRAIRDHKWPTDVGELKVRMGLHVGYVERNALGYVGLEVHRASRVASAAHGGQLLLSATAHSHVAENLPTDSLGWHRLKDFPQAEHLYCAVVDGRGATAFPPPRVQTARPNNLPAGTTFLVGRDAELDRVVQALDAQRERLVTLTGRSGAGKTSLALSAARQLLDSFEGGVWLVDLTTVRESSEVTAAVARGVGVRGETQGSASDAAISRLRDRGRTLLLIDNLEHVLDAAPELACLLEALPNLQILATSQAPLRLADELRLPLDALDDEAALALVERVARRRDPDIRIDDRNREALLEMIHLLDGLPLALELAAARLALLSPQQLLDRLQGSTDMLRDDRPDRPDRHRSLVGTVDWSLSLLDPPARALFTRLGAFADPVEVEDLEAVCGRDGLDVLETLFGLLEVALVRRVESGDGRIRFGLPEGLRQIAARQLEKAPDGEDWRRAHAERQLEIIWPARFILTTRAHFQAAVDATAERAAALRWGRATGDPIFRPLAAAHAIVAGNRGYVRDAVATIEPLLSEPSQEPEQRALELIALTGIRSAMAQTELSIEASSRALELPVGDLTRSYALLLRGTALLLRGTGMETSDVGAAVRDIDEGVRLARHSDDAFLAGALVLASQAHLFAQDFDGATQRIEEAEQLAEGSDADFIWRRHTLRGDMAALRGQYAEALAHYAVSLEEAEARQHEMQILFDLVGSALALAEGGQDEAALEAAGMTRAHAHDIGSSEQHTFHMLSNEALSDAQARLGEARAAEARRRGESVPAPGRVTRACELCRALAVSG
jgi:predicted ATPase/class 3 adenylate cyclase